MVLSWVVLQFTMTPSGPANDSYVQNSVDLALKIHQEDGESIMTKHHRPNALKESRPTAAKLQQSNWTHGVGFVCCRIMPVVVAEPGHILIFLTGQDEIEKACSLLNKAAQEFRKRASQLQVGHYLRVPP